jgi:hypothetical protein
MSFYDRQLQPGGSGYFSEPSDTLDPSLFDGMILKPAVRSMLVTTLSSGLRQYLDMNGVSDWLRAWLAGSGITYQWAADRGNGDLDVLFGVDMPSFTRYNPQYQGIPERDVADYADDVLKRKLWPATAHTTFGQQEYEVTFFWAPGTGQGIDIIHPYAAYDLTAGTWVVPPPELPHDPRALYPGEWYDEAGRDRKDAARLSARHSTLTSRLSSMDEESPRGRNAASELARVRQSAMALFSDIHGGRREAFGEQGHGYGDYANFRWQAAKQSGTVGALKAIVDAATRASGDRDDSLYGGYIDGPQAILTRDALRYGAGR